MLFAMPMLIKCFDMKRSIIILVMSVLTGLSFAQTNDMIVLPVTPTAITHSCLKEKHQCSGQQQCNKNCCKSNTLLEDSLIIFNDEGFKFYCLHAADQNKDGEVSYNEAASVILLNCEYGGRRNMHLIADYEGIQYFTNLEEFITGISNVKVLDLYKNTKLKKITTNVLDKLETIILSKECEAEIINPPGKPIGCKIIVRETL